MKYAITLSLLVLAACGSPQRATVAMSPEVQAAWDRCAERVEQWCVEHSHGSPAERRTCMHDESDRFARLSDDAARASYLGTHGCPQVPATSGN